MKARKAILVFLLTSVFTSIGFIFWYNEFVYSLPTPVPDNYLPVPVGSTITIPRGINPENNKSVFLHFFNPDCPCSKFNINHVRSLVKQYSDKTTFAIVVLNNSSYTERQIQEKFKLKIPVLFDTAIAASCGVYSTPQAVIIDHENKLFYRGNYNRSRYCSDEKTAYARQALDNLISNDSSTIINPYALTAYGCRLPVCKK